MIFGAIISAESSEICPAPVGVFRSRFQCRSHIEEASPEEHFAFEEDIVAESNAAKIGCRKFASIDTVQCLT
jgi:hypothetical protein